MQVCFNLPGTRQTPTQTPWELAPYGTRQLPHMLVRLLTSSVFGSLLSNVLSQPDGSLLLSYCAEL
jgi:hypothetical protein